MTERKRRGFVQLDNDLFLRAADLGLNTVDVAIIGVVQARRNSRTGQSFASYGSIGASIGKSGDTVKRRVTRMRDEGLLVVSDRQHDERGHCTGHNYDFAPLFERLAALSPVEKPGGPRGGSHQGTTAHEGTDAHQGITADPTRAPVPPEQDVENKKREVNLSQGSNGVEQVERAEEDHRPPSLTAINGDGNGDGQGQPPLLAPVKASADVQQLARRLWQILDGGFGSLIDPEPTWKRPTRFAVSLVLERHQPAALVAEEAARVARATCQAKQDGRNVVRLFECVLTRKLDHQAKAHRQVVAELGEVAS